MVILEEPCTCGHSMQKHMVRGRPTVCKRSKCPCLGYVMATDEEIKELAKDLLTRELAFNQFEVVCKNQECNYFDQKRLVSLPIVASGIYQVGSLRCKCHFTPMFISKDV